MQKPQRRLTRSSKSIQKGPDRHAGRASIACDHCREKKLRCDGLQPKCSRCRDKGLDCIVSRRDMRRSSTTGDERQSVATSSSDSSIRQSASVDVIAERQAAQASPVPLRDLRPGQRVAFPPNVTPSGVPTARFFPVSSSSSASRLYPTPQAQFMAMGSDSQSLMSASSAFDWSHMDFTQETPRQESQQQQPQSQHQQQSRPLSYLEGYLDPSLLIMAGARPPFNRQDLLELLQSQVPSGLSTSSMQTLEGSGYSTNTQTSQSRSTSVQSLTATVMPHPRILLALIPIFLQRFGDQFPFLNSEQLIHRVNDRSSYPLITAICALAVRATEAQAIRDPFLRRAVDLASSYATETIEYLHLHLAEMKMDPTDDMIATFLFFTLHQLSIRTSPRFLVFMEASVSSVQEYARRSTNHVAENVSSSALYWNVYAFHQMFSLARGRRPSFQINSLIPIPNITLEQGQQSTFGYYIQLMKIVASLSDCVYGEGSDRAIIRRLERLQTDLSDWQMNLPASLRQATAARNILRQEPCLYLQVYLWFYCSLTLVQQQLENFRTQLQGGVEETSEPIQEWANQKTAEFVILYRSIRPQMLVSCPMVYYPLFIALEQSRVIVARKSSSSSFQSAPSRILLAQFESNVALFSETVAELEQFWPGIRALLG